MKQAFGMSAQTLDVICFRLAVFDSIPDSAQFFRDEQCCSKPCKRIEDDLSLLRERADEMLQHIFRGADVFMAKSGGQNSFISPRELQPGLCEFPGLHIPISFVCIFQLLRQCALPASFHCSSEIRLKVEGLKVEMLQPSNLSTCNFRRFSCPASTSRSF
jgi:hypothetical protein